MSESLPAPQGHCLYSPSSLARLDLCPASARLCALVPEDAPSEAALRGTRIHQYAAEMIQNGAIEASIGDGADEEELKFAAKIRDYALALIGGCKFFVEKRIAYNDINGEVYYGTSDLIILRPNKVVIRDWKTGFGDVPEASINLQGAAYALAAMQVFRVDGAEVGFYNPCTGWESVTDFDSPEGLAREVLGVIERAKDPNAPFNPSEDACRYCRAKSICAAHLATCEASCRLVEMKQSTDITTWRDEDLSLWYSRLTLASKWLETIVKPELLRRIAEQGECGGLRVKQQSGGREATDVQAVMQAMSKVLGEDDILQCCSLSVAQLKDKYVDMLRARGEVKTKKEAEAMFEVAVAGLSVDKNPKRVVYRTKEVEA